MNYHTTEKDDIRMIETKSFNITKRQVWEAYKKVRANFLGFTFQPRLAKNSKTGQFFVGFNPAISTKSAKRIRLVMRRWKIQLRSDLSIEELSDKFSRVIKGWVNYYSIFARYKFFELMRYFDRRLERWAKRKFKSLKRRQGSKKRAKSISTLAT